MDDTLDPLVEAQIAETVQLLIPTELTEIVERITDMEEITLSMFLFQMCTKYVLLALTVKLAFTKEIFVSHHRVRWPESTLREMLNI